MGVPAEEVKLHPQKTEEWLKVSELPCAAQAAAGLLGLPPGGAVSAPLAGAGPAGKMAPSTLLRPFSRLLSPARLPSVSSARSKFYVRDPPDDNKANWLKVGLTLGTTVFLWFYLIKEHHEDVLEYKRRNGLE